MRENTDQKNSEYGYFSRNDCVVATLFQSDASAELELDFELPIVSEFFVQIRLFKIIRANSNISGVKKSK